MTNRIAELETASNALTKQGKIIDSIDNFYADDCVFIEPDGSSRSSKSAQRAHLEGFFRILGHALTFEIRCAKPHLSGGQTSISWALMTV